MTRFNALLAAGAALALLAPHGAPAQSAFKCSTASINDAGHEWCKRFAPALTARSGGKIQTEVYAGGQLGDVPRQLEGMQLGTIEANGAPGAFFVGIDPRFQVLDAPGVFDSFDHMYRTVTDAAFRERYLALGESKGIVGISMVAQAPNSVAAKKPIRAVEDFRGLKLRVFGSPLQIEPIKALGATPSPMPLGETLPALQTGVIDGALGSIVIFAVGKYHTAARHVTQLPFSYVIIMMAVSKSWMDKAPEAHRQLARAIGRELEKEIYEWSKLQLPVAAKQWTDAGGEIITLAPAEATRINDLVRPVGPRVMAERPAVKELYDVLLATAQKNR